MITSDAGRAAIRAREGVRLIAYPDPGTGGEPWSIGIGHTGRASPPVPYRGMTCSVAEADAWLAADLAPMETAVNESCGVLGQNQFDACVSLAFNIGPGAFRLSSVARSCHLGRWQAAADAFRLYNRSAGRVMQGLADRRESERAQFLTPDTVQVTTTVAYRVPAPAVPSPGPIAIPAAHPSVFERVRAWFTGKAA